MEDGLMGVRDDDIKKLRAYAKKHGAKVRRIKSKKGAGSAEWDLDTQLINLYITPFTSKTNIILDLLHELGHQMDWIAKKRKVSKEVLAAFNKLCQGNMYGERPDLTQKQRDLIHRDEAAGIYYMHKIWAECGLSLPQWKVKRQQYLDLLDYKELAMKGKFLTTRQYKKIKKNTTPYFRRMFS